VDGRAGGDRRDGELVARGNGIAQGDMKARQADFPARIERVQGDGDIVFLSNSNGIDGGGKSLDHRPTIRHCQRWHNSIFGRQPRRFRMPQLSLHPDRLFPADPDTRAIARELYAQVAGLPIVSPHGHTDPAWFASDAAWTNATELLLAPDHYLFRMLYSQGIDLDALAVPRKGGLLPDTDPREAWRLFAANWHLFRGTPSSMSPKSSASRSRWMPVRRTITTTR
jgi:hypothetical protein